MFCLRNQDITDAKAFFYLFFMSNSGYYYEFGKKYKGSIHSTPLFSPILDKNWIEQQSQMEDYYSNKFKNIKRKGDNPEIFQYAFYQDTFNNMLVVQMWFYEEYRTYALLFIDSLW